MPGWSRVCLGLKTSGSVEYKLVHDLLTSALKSADEFLVEKRGTMPQEGMLYEKVEMFGALCILAHQITHCRPR